MKGEFHYKRLLQRYFDDACHPEEKRELMAYLSSDSANKVLLSVIRERYESRHNLAISITDERSNIIKNKLLEQLKEKEILTYKIKRLVYRAVSIAASIILLIAIFFLNFNKNDHQKISLSKALAIHSGTNGAILITSNGKRVDLNEHTKAAVANSLGLSMSKTVAGEVTYSVLPYDLLPESLKTEDAYSVIKTPRGGKCRLVLSDSTVVLLDPESSIRFPVKFASDQRSVEADGDVYFDVAKHAHRPFKVITGTQTIEVLGTKFVVSSSSVNAEIKTTLLEGSIKLSAATNTRILKPGEQSTYNAQKGNIIVTNVSTKQESVAWVDNYFVFNDTGFAEVQEQLEKWYDVKFQYQHMPANHFYGRIPRTAKLAEVLEMIKVTGNIHFNVEGRVITVSEGNQ